MPASVSLSGLVWSTPDGTRLFDDLNLSFGPERTGIVGRNGTGKSTLLRLIAGDLRPLAGQLRIAGSVAMLRQQVVDSPGQTIAALMGAEAGLAALDRAMAGQGDAQALADADWGLPARIEAALLRCGLSVSPQTPLARLSGGQRVRAGLAALILRAPDMLLLDEPTNNLDRDGREAVFDLVRGWRGGVILASHDRDLLDEMDAIVALTSLGATRHGGNYSAFCQMRETALAAAQHDLAHAEKSSREAALRARQAAERKARKDAAGQRTRRRGGQPRILLDAAKGRAEASGGASARLREARQAEAGATLTAARARVEVLQPLRMDIGPTGLAAGRAVLRLTGLTGGFDPARPVIRDLSLTITGPERVAIAGPNGCGKSTLLAMITGQLAPLSGRAEPLVPFAFLDQHVGLLDPAAPLYRNFCRLNPGSDRGAAQAALARFGFRAEAATRPAATLSGGERLRAGLACVLAGAAPPMLLILDEPTNHLDLDGIAALETALDSYDGAVLAVSHDRRFLEALRPGRRLRLA